MFRINPSSSQPIYEQVIAEVKESILKGALREGEKLPSVRELAEMTRVNPNTISKAYKALEQERIIVTLRGRGTFVNENLNIKTDATALSQLRKKFKELLVEFHYFGVHEKETHKMIEDIYKELRKEADHAES